LEDIEYAKQEGYYFNPKLFTHDELVTGVKKLKGLLPADNSEREKLLEILGHCGILETEQQKGFINYYINHDSISVPYRKTDLSYPVSWWRGKDGINMKNLEKIFGNLI
jgi:hypothetical protein